MMSPRNKSRSIPLQCPNTNGRSTQNVSHPIGERSELPFNGSLGSAYRWQLLATLLAALLLSLSVSPPLHAQRLSALATPPAWEALESFQETITRGAFARLLDEVYAPGGAAADFISLGEHEAVIKKTLSPESTWVLRFARDEASASPPIHPWRSISDLSPADTARPLEGMRIAIDPGHLGGTWARMEERWFQIGQGQPVTEGDMTLLVAMHLAPLLKNMGAIVIMARSDTQPVTPMRPKDFRSQAKTQLADRNILHPRDNYRGPDDPHRGGSIQAESELLFYRVSEIRHRAKLVNEEARPDLVLCLHFNAEGWGDPRKPQFVEASHLHTLLNGCYSAAELRHDDLRYDMLARILSRTIDEEIPINEHIAAALAEAANLPPYEYPGNNARRVGDGMHVWARNLLANRLYNAPVAFLEPYVMNNATFCERAQAGDYEGMRTVAGAARPSVFREYAQAVAEGLRTVARQRRPLQPTVPK